jgi:DNA topoisomerase-1
MENRKVLAENRNYIMIKKTKKSFRGINEKLTSKNLSRLNSMYIPPAYKTIYLSKNPTNKVQLIAEDSKGRNQYFYNPEYTSKSDTRKYKALRSLVSIAEKIEDDNKDNINKIYNKLSRGSEIDENDYIHIVIWLLINKHFRIGNIKYDKLYNSTGITTLKPCHFKLSNNAVNISFIGKKGVENNDTINDSKLISIIKNIKMRYGNHNNVDYIFAKSNGGLIKSEDITNYFNNKLGVSDITPKMFRTYYANYHMLDYLQSGLKKDEYNNLTEKRRRSYLKKAISKYVSSRLHNTPSICRSKYINNKLLEKIISNPNYYSTLGDKNTNIHQQLKRFIG